MTFSHHPGAGRYRASGGGVQGRSCTIPTAGVPPSFKATGSETPPHIYSYYAAPLVDASSPRHLHILCHYPRTRRLVVIGIKTNKGVVGIILDGAIYEEKGGLIRLRFGLV